MDTLTGNGKNISVKESAEGIVDTETSQHQRVGRPHRNIEG